MDKYDEYPMFTKIVLHLIDPLLDYYVTTNNFYKHPQLADYLLQRRTDIYKTLRTNRKDLLNV